MNNFTNKLNKVEGKVYVIEEMVTLLNGVYESVLQHDNINVKTLSVYSGSKLTGDKIDTYALSTPSDTPWKRIIRVYANYPVVYISYETDGDTVEADDINYVQDVIMETQGNLSQEIQRAKDAEQLLDNDIKRESQRAETAEKVLSDALDSEIGRAEQAEAENANAISLESARAKEAEETLKTELNAETIRALSAETDLQNIMDLHTESVNAEIHRLNQADINLDEKKANVSDMNRELNNRYIKNEVFTKEEVLKKMEDLIGSAPETLDTLKEIAEALGNDPNFAATIMTILSEKVEKEAGKGLSSNDFTTILLNKLHGISDGANNYTHPQTHPAAIITENATHRFATDAEKSSWNGKASGNHAHNYAGSTSAGGAATTALTCTGNSVTASKLTNTCKINGVNFDGTEDITVEDNTKLLTTGGTITGVVRMNQGCFVHCTSGIGGVNGYVRIAQISIHGVYANVPVELKLMHRGMSEAGKLIISYDNENSVDPKLRLFYRQGGVADSYMYKSGVGLWELYVKKNEAYDYIAIMSFEVSPYISGSIVFDWKTDQLEALPSGAVGAAEIGKETATSVTDGFMSKADKVKLDGISVGANNYTHPANHPPSTITQDANNRFTKDTEKNLWNSHVANKSNPHNITAAQIGAASSSHNHDTSYIKKGTTWNGLNGV